MAWTYDEETEIYTVPYIELDDLLTSLDDNTKETPYKLNIIDLTVIEFIAPFPLRNKIKNYPTKYIDISYTDIPDSIKNSITNFDYMFSDCSTLVGCFDLWAGITSMEICFSQCSSLKKSPKLPTEITDMFMSFINSGIEEIIVPPNVTNLYDTFSSCSSLKKVYFETNSSFSNINMNNVFIYCTSLELICVNKSLNSSLISILKTQQNQRYFPTEIVISNIVKNYWYDVNKETYIVTDLLATSDLLQSLPQNSVRAPYKLDIRNMSSSDVVASMSVDTVQTPSTICSQITSGQKYVDLSETKFPNATSIKGCFYECEYLTNTPQVPTNVTNMDYAFYNCINANISEDILSQVVSSSLRMSNCFYHCSKLTVMPDLINGVTVLDYCFSNCNLVKTKEIPNTVESMNGTFALNRNLTEVINIPNVEYMIDCFNSCISLSKINDWNFNSSGKTINNFNGCFYACPLYRIYKSGYSGIDSLITFLNNIKQVDGIDEFINPSEITFYKYTEDVSIPITSLNEYLQHTEDNTEESPYQIIITGLNSTNLGKSSVNNTLGNIIKNNTKYISIKNTQFPASITTLEESFYQCMYLVEAPNTSNMSALLSLTNMKKTFGFTKIHDVFIPQNVKILEGTFLACINITGENITIPNGVTNMGYCFNACENLTQSPEIPSSVTTINVAFSTCTSLEKMPVIPNGVTNMNNAFNGCSNLKSLTVIPDSVKDVGYCFSHCSSIEYVPSVPSSCLSESDSISDGMFQYCTSLKSVILFDKFETLTSIHKIFCDCENLESIFVKSSQNRSDLISELEEQQDRGFFPSDLVVSEVVKFNEKILKVHTEKSIEKIKLYRSKEQLLTKKNGQFVYADETEKPFTVNINGEDFYAQTLRGELIDDCKIKGTGFVLKKFIGDEPVFIAKQSGRIETPFDLPKQELYRITADGTLDVDGSLLPKGGVIFVCSGKGSGVSGSIGGNGYVHRVEILSNTDVTINAAFSISPDSNGETGETASVGDYYCSGGRGYETCVPTTTYGSGTPGGSGGSNIDVTVIVGNKTKNITVYGGGGGGGLGGVATGYTDCFVGVAYLRCVYDGKKTSTADGGYGGLTGAGTGTRNSPNERIGGAGLSYNQENLSGKYLEWVSDACVIVYKYTE